MQRKPVELYTGTAGTYPVRHLCVDSDRGRHESWNQRLRPTGMNSGFGTTQRSQPVPLAGCAYLSLAATLLVLTGCHHAMQTASYQPPPPVSAPSLTHYAPPPAASGFYDNTSSKPVLVETGLASWYGPNYHHHAAADGTTFDQNALTAAHRTLPLGTTVRVTNLATGQQVLVRITDRGPFAPDRVLDLSRGAADAIGGVRAGIFKVKLEAFAHTSADPDGRWAVQTGAFKAEQDALDLKSALGSRYKGARVTEFAGPTGFWVRIDPATHERKQAEAMLDWIGKPGPSALPYLVRLD